MGQRLRHLQQKRLFMHIFRENFPLSHDCNFLGLFVVILNSRKEIIVDYKKGRVKIYGDYIRLYEIIRWK